MESLVLQRALHNDPEGSYDLRCAVGSILGLRGMIDKFNWFCLANKDKEFLKPYRSPQGESSLFKNIPIGQLDLVKKMMRQLGVDARIVYRGPRLNQIDPSCTHKADAERFSVYVR